MVQPPLTPEEQADFQAERAEDDAKKTVVTVAAWAKQQQIGKKKFLTVIEMLGLDDALAELRPFDEEEETDG